MLLIVQDPVVNVVVASEMSSSMQMGTVDIINLALIQQGSSTDYEDLAGEIKQGMESKYGGHWCCVAGPGTYG